MLVSGSLEQILVDVASRDDKDDGAFQLGELRKCGETGGSSALDPDTGVREGDDCAGELALGGPQHLRRDVAEDLDRVGNRDPDGEPVRERRATLAGYRPSCVEAVCHHGRLGGDDSDPLRLRRAGEDRAADTAQQRAVPDGHDDGGRRLVELGQELVADRRVALVLRRLGAVLEERHAAPLGLGAAELLRLVHVRAGRPDLRAEVGDAGELRRARLFRDEDDRLEAKPRSRPGGRRAVVPGRGGDDGPGTAGLVALEHGERAAPLERAEFVRVFAFEVEAPPLGEARGCRFERCRDADPTPPQSGGARAPR